ncbi:MAG: hypothetical protein V2B18_07200 [Pseudomonadota bacterium]
MRMIRRLGLLTALLLTLVWVLAAGAADKGTKPWFVIKAKDGSCRVLQAADKTPKTIAGPFATRDMAEKMKDEKCPPKSKKK